MGASPDRPNPKAFVSHSSADKDRFVLAFARELRSRFGVDAWVDRWEIRPGDSFVDRIYEEGIGGADAFLVVISSNTIDSSWVKDELDAGTVDRIERGTRLIPIILDGLQKEQLPKQLHHLHWIRVDDVADHEFAANQVARAIFGQDSDKPALGPPPSYSTSDIQIPGMGADDAAVLLAIGEQTVGDYTGFVRNPDSVRQAVAKSGIDDEAFLSCVRFLHERGLLKDDPIGMSGTLHVLWLSQQGIRTYLRARGVDLDLLQRNVAAHVVNHPSEQHHYKDLAKMLDATPLAVGFVVEELATRKLLRVTKTMGDNLHASDPSESLRRMIL